VANGGGAGPRWLEVGPDRIERWLADFASRHGETGTSVDATRAVITVTGADGSRAECHIPFPPLAAAVRGTAADLAAHAAGSRTVGVVLVRLGGYAAGVFTGSPPKLVSSKVGSRLVHGRSAAGGQSQQRFARRREKQAREALEAAADCAAAVLGPFEGQLDAVVFGGDKRSVAELRGDVRLRPYFDLGVDRFLTVPDPRLAVLRATPRAFSAVRIRLTEAPASGV